MQDGKHLSDYYMPATLGGWERTAGNALIADKLQWNRTDEAALAREWILQLNTEPKTAFNIIINGIEQVQPEVFFYKDLLELEKHICIKLFSTIDRHKVKLFYVVHLQQLLLYFCLADGLRTPVSRFLLLLQILQHVILH